MYKLVDASSYQKITNRYFSAWKSYDVLLLREIFSTDAKYIIRNKGISYHGIHEIEEYWNRNKRRQINLRLSWVIKSHSISSITAYFHASFFELDDGIYSHVQGEIIFYVNYTGKITKLTELYRKTHKKNEKSENFSSKNVNNAVEDSTSIKERKGKVNILTPLSIHI